MTMTAPAIAPPAVPRGLVMAFDDEVLDGLLRLAAAAGCELERVPDAASARRGWTAAPLVLLDVDAAARAARAGLPRRDGVVVVVPGTPPPEVWEVALRAGAAHVVSLPEAERWLVARLAEAAEAGGAEPGRLLAVVGGRGGAGASVLAAAVAVAAVQEGGRALLVDCDPLGGGLDLALGAEHLPGLRWPGIDVGAGRITAAALHAALPAPPVAGGGELGLIACDRAGRGPSPAAVRAVLDAGRRAGETVVCDLPRYPTEAAVAVLVEADLVVVVVPADVRGAAAAEQVAAVVAEHARRVRLVVRGPAPGGVAAADVADALRLPLLAAMRPEPDLARALDRGGTPGRPRGPLADAARAVIAELAAAAAGSLA